MVGRNCIMVGEIKLFGGTEGTFLEEGGQVLRNGGKLEEGGNFLRKGGSSGGSWRKRKQENSPCFE